MRIISGLYKGRKIHAPKNLPVRPTTDQAKEALFNILNNNFYITDTIILDIYSGTGNISYEFASRGSKNITSVDINNKCINFIKSVSNELSFNIKTIKSDVYKFIKSCNLDFDIIFADPPYKLESEKYEKLISLIIKNNLLKNDGLLIIEHSKNISLINIKKYFETREYGGGCFCFFKS
ncbi:uncharacterized protein METZ01_LOCUS52689 [marine metagenome]|uniref:Methyltransferase domain-containing protein n=1 Tax=marine metagenome TaxID=408172 RepID=A0A381S6X0_9ZZZZ